MPYSTLQILCWYLGFLFILEILDTYISLPTPYPSYSLSISFVWIFSFCLLKLLLLKLQSNIFYPIRIGSFGLVFNRLLQFPSLHKILHYVLKNINSKPRNFPFEIFSIKIKKIRKKILSAFSSSGRGFHYFEFAFYFHEKLLKLIYGINKSYF